MRGLPFIAWMICSASLLAGEIQTSPEAPAPPVSVPPLPFETYRPAEQVPIVPAPFSLEIPPSEHSLFLPEEKTESSSVEAVSPMLVPEQEIPPDPEAILDAQRHRKPEQVSVSTVGPSDDKIVDLRPPEFSFDGVFRESEPSWMNEVIDDHLLLWRNVTDSLQTVPRAGTDFGITTIGFKGDLAGSEGPFWVSGYFGWNFLSGPSTAAVSPQTYDLGVELNYARNLNETWGVSLTVSPLFSTDFSNNSSDAFRMTAGGLLSFQADDVTRLVAGLSYLDRPDLPFLPIAGLKWLVTENLEMDLLVPRPRLAWRFDHDESREAWVYTGGQVGGGSWAIQRENGQNDRLGYKDLRWVCGVESRKVSGSRRVLEAGYVFARKISLMRGPGDESVGNTFVFHWGRLY